MHDFLTEWLVCPDCHGELVWHIDERVGSHIESGRGRCTSCRLEFPVGDGIGVFLLGDLTGEDLWRDVDSALISYLRDNPEVDEQLMGSPLESLAPADQFFRALALEEQADFDGADRAESLALERLYTADYRECADSQIAYLVERARQGSGPIVDLASGRGYLVRRLAGLKNRPVVASDFSLTVLRRNRRWLKHAGLYERVSLLAFDARRTPFRNGVVPLLTTYLGLPNIERPGDLLAELRRVVGGTFMAVSHFYPVDDAPNRQAIRQAGLEALLYRATTLERFTKSGWAVEVANVCRGSARPTPRGVIIMGAGIDGLPDAQTTLEWCVLVGR